LKPPSFDYAVPATLQEAIGLLAEHAEAEARVQAGGQSLIPLLYIRLAKPGYLVDLRRVAGLSGIRREGDTLVIGAMTRMAEVERSPEVAVAAPLVTEAIGLVAHAPVRNSGTIGGSLAHADPAAELPAAALALDAELVAAGPGGTRTIPAAEFFTGPYSTALAAEVAVAALVALDGDRIRQAAVALAGMAPTPVRARLAEQALLGSPGDAETIGRAAQAAVADLSPAGDLHASAESRLSLAQTYVRRGLELAVTRARNQR
jgi:carbon-monoxide dehydrogenase medium subunit